jgi:capsular polysaccharide biosynthesis protein
MDIIAPSRKVQLDVRIDEVVLRALEQSPELRYQTAIEFRTGVETVQTAAPPGANPSAIPTPSRPRGMIRRWWWMWLVMIPVGIATGLMIGMAFNSIIPKKFEAETVIEVQPVGGAITTTPQFFGTEIEKIKSGRNLAEVSKRLKLPNRWRCSDETAIEILEGIVITQNIRGTDLISVRVRHINPQDTAAIANSVTQVYRESSSISMVVHDVALVPRIPVSPNMRRNLVLAGMGGLLLSPFLALPVMLLCQRVFRKHRNTARLVHRSDS